ncbi:cell division protein FtsQ/DivIB [Salinarimonas ramus]|uniref:Cell division protein FtsQ n=1 Tax=Salinarimonas ramus TaxID=690164 RepID=A0A917Q706_9HYPH|nr:cell division protein FtsQ/DivIB [Salinarimonas ramus]GGK30066.1 cell division protein FtsQ [Salinarimonas ramus]
MDGGGRLAEPLTAGSPGGAEARAGFLRGLRLDALGSVLPAAFRRRGPIARLERRLPRFAGSMLLCAFFGATAFAGLSAGGRLDAFFAQNGSPRDIVARAFGFGIEAITISGIGRLDEREVLSAAGIDPRASLPFLDVGIAREQLESLPLVGEASVRKLFPNQVTIGIVEREPFALWQVDGRVYVIAADGQIIDVFHDDPRYRVLPHVVGEGANTRLEDYFAIVDAAGPLRARIRAGSLVAERRWTLTLDSGIDLRLPERDPMAALERFVALERDHAILEKDIIAVDLRMPDRIVVRLTEEAAAARAEEMEDRVLRGRGVRT